MINLVVTEMMPGPVGLKKSRPRGSKEIKALWV